MKVLFVDDEPLVLEALERSLMMSRVGWETAFVTGGEAALEVLANSPYDVVVSDMRMPGMDGVALLSLVCERYPAAVRIVLSGQADPSSALRIARVAHQFLSKPCDAQTLRRVVERTGALRRVLGDDKLRALVGGMNRLPSAVRIFHELSSLLERDEASLDAVVDLIRQDPAMSLKLLQLVNSSFFSHSREVVDVRTAVVRLGMKTLRSLTLAIGVFETKGSLLLPEGYSIDEFQRRAFQIARIASESVVDANDKEPAFTAGLVCDVGELVLAAAAPERLAAVWGDGDGRTQSRCAAEREEWGASHAEVGACLLELWGLPFRVVEAVAHHHEPHRATPAGLGLSSAVWIASCLAVGEQLDPALVDACGAGATLERAQRFVATS